MIIEDTFLDLGLMKVIIFTVVISAVAMPYFAEPSAVSESERKEVIEAQVVKIAG